ncbi:MAG: SpoIIE family protein phosphatase [Candidatus Omnitrophica bacterium]|nr:SpoIIE family protein phosphatase [Candidatus Omnitrophota bacterium]
MTDNQSLSEDRFRILFEHASDAHFIINDSGITDCNEAAVAMLKCRSKAEVLSRHPRVLSPEYQPDGSHSMTKSKEMDAIAFKNGWHRFEWVHQRSDGETFPVQVTLNAVEIDGRPSLIAVWHDLTEIKRNEEALTKLNRRMKDELDSASAFQRSLLPAMNPGSERFSSAWFYKPCDELGGDSLSIIQIDPEHVGIYVLDVTGHGVASALLSVTVTHFLSGYVKNHDYCPQQLVEFMNAHFSRERYVNHSFTMVYGVLHLKTGKFTYTSAGHIGPIVVRKDGLTEQLEGHGPPIGLFTDAEYGRSEVYLNPCDQLVLISDGVYEIRNSGGEEFGLDRVYHHLSEEVMSGRSLDYAVNSLAREVFHWRIPDKPDDDISIAALELK